MFVRTFENFNLKENNTMRFVEGEEKPIKKPMGNHKLPNEWRKTHYMTVPGVGIRKAVPIVKGGGSFFIKVDKRWLRGAFINGTLLNRENPYVFIEENDMDNSFTVHPWDESKYGKPISEPKA